MSTIRALLSRPAVSYISHVIVIIGRSFLISSFHPWHRETRSRIGVSNIRSRGGERSGGGRGEGEGGGGGRAEKIVLTLLSLR